MITTEEGIMTRIRTTTETITALITPTNAPLITATIKKNPKDLLIINSMSHVTDFLLR